MTERRGAIVVFSKVPRVGGVKTRLAARLGHLEACRLYEAFLADTFDRAARVAERVGARLVFAHGDAAIDRAALGDWLPATAVTFPQRGGDLGARMDAAIRDAGGERVVLIGGDSPSMRIERLVEAFAACDHGEVALGPVEDGGYNLIGLPVPAPELFRDIAWSTPSVFATTERRARDAGLRIRVLDVGYDVDRPEDLDRLRTDPALASAPRTSERLTALRSA
jgi:hypothetical protein